MRARLVVTGDELLRGFIADRNTVFLANSLRQLGVELAGVSVSPDDQQSIQAAVQAARDADLIVVTGGLGPTHDDRTSAAVAAVFDRPLELDPAALEMVEERVSRFARARGVPLETYADGNRKQATLPRSAFPLPPFGTAPGFVMKVGECTIVVLPGPPTEARHAWTQAVTDSPLVPSLHTVSPPHERTLRIRDVPESAFATMLNEAEHVDDDAVRVTVCARYGELEISIRGRDHASVDRLVDHIQEEFSSSVFAVDDERSIAEIVLALARERSMTIATAESCTGGMIATQLTDVPGSSDVVVGSIVAYANSVKLRQLGVAQQTLFECGAVSRETAREMAAGVRRLLAADLAVAVTGIAGPGGGSPDKPVGLVWIAIEDAHGAEAWRIQLPGDRSTVRTRTTVQALHRLRERLLAQS